MAKRGRPPKELSDAEIVMGGFEDPVKAAKAKKKTVKKPKVDSVMESMMSAAEKEFGQKGLYVGSEEDIATDGFSLRHLALQWMLDTNVLSLGKMLVVAGLKMSGKSSFAYFLADLFMESGGGAVLIDTENKVSPSLLVQMITNPENLKSRYIYRSTKEMEDWMSTLNFFITQVEDAHKRAKKNLTPVLAIVDSLMGSASKDQHKEIKKLGAPKAGYDRSTIIVSREFKALSDRLVGLPMDIVVTNHLKHDLSDPFGHAMRTPGGDAPGYHSSYELWFTGRRQLKRGPVPEGFLIKMKVNKNSMGACWRELKVPFHWKIVHDEEVGVRKAWFDWDYALSDLIVRLHEHPEFKENVLVAEVKEVTTTEPMKAKIRCPDAGVNDFVLYAEFGKLIQENEEFMSKFNNFFNMPKHTVLDFNA